MKMLTNVTMLVTIVLLSTTLFAAPSGEAVNPFSQFTSSSGGVSLFTGSAAYSQPLVTLSTRGAISLPISLAYSSNVELNARADNKIAPTSWVGLGWQMGFGKIVANHNNTMTFADDNYTWISPEGVPYIIYIDSYKDGQDVLREKIYVQDRLYVKVERFHEGYYTKGWKITDEAGNSYKYGICCNSTETCAAEEYKCENTIWYTLCWEAEGHVGKGFSGEPKPYPYQWQIAEMVDIGGNWIRFDYDTIVGDVSYEDNVANPPLVWSPDNKYYTKESYIKQITSNNGTTVTFNTDAKSTDEYYVPRAGQVTGKETDQPIYETKRLKNIEVTNEFGTLTSMLNINFEYAYIGTRSFKKALLKKIIIENGKADNGVKGKTVTWFNYYTEAEDENGFYGTIPDFSSSGVLINIANSIDCAGVKALLLFCFHGTTSVLLLGSVVYGCLLSGA